MKDSRCLLWLVWIPITLCLALFVGAAPSPEKPRVTDTLLSGNDQPTGGLSTHSEPTIPDVSIRFNKATDETPDFQRHVSPLLGRLGCNGRACHGSFQGQGGFRLTLFGFDFDKDHQSLTEDGTYRVDLEDPAESLILTKPTDADMHEGGLRYEEDGWQHRLLKNWVAGGAKNAPVNNLRVKLEITPTEIVTANNLQHQLRVVANWSDGIREDVTPLVRFQSNDPQVAAVNETGLVTGGASGDTHIVIFYDNEVVSIPVLSPVVSTAANRDPAKAMRFENATRVDELVVAKLDKLGIVPSAVADDSTFLRRVSLDITGTLPSPDEIRVFLNDSRADKRSRKIEELLSSKAYVAWWTTFLCDMTGNNSRELRNVAYNDLPAKGWYRWIFDRIEKNVPYDQIVEGIVLSASRVQGESLVGYSERMSQDYRENSTDRFVEMPTMPYYWMRQSFRDGDTRAISFAHSFLGVRLQCAQCHKHPFDQWTQDDFRQFARFFSGVATSPAQRASREESGELKQIFADLGFDPAKMNGGNLRRKLNEALRAGKTVPFPELVVGPPRKSREELRQEQMAMQKQATQDLAAADQKSLTRKQRQKLQQERRRALQLQRNRNRFYTDAILLGSDSVELSDFDDARLPAMNWLKHSDNPWFARAIVNRIWARYFGVGIVEPADDLSLANPPSNGPLLEYLTDGFVENGYDLKWLHREIANSHVYQLSWEPNETNRDDRRNFSRALPRRLAAEIVYDAIAQSTSGEERNQQYRVNIDKRAIAIPGTASPRGRRNQASPSFALRIFGKSERTSSCDCDRSNETSLIQTVYLQNDRDIHQMLSREDGWLGQLRSTVNGQALTKEDRKKLTRGEERLRELQLNLRKARNGKDQERTQRLERQVKRLNQQLKVLRKRKSSQIDRETPKLETRQLVTEAWLRTLSRFPTEDELATCEKYIQADNDVVHAMTGIMWSLLNTREFIVNH